MRRAAWGVGYLYVAALVVYIHIRFTGLDWYRPASFQSYLANTVERPWAGRVLMPMLVKLLSAMVPPWAQQWALGLYRANGPFTDAQAYPAEVSFAKLVFAALAVVCFVGTGYLLRALVRHYYGWSEPAASAAGLLGMLLIPSMFRYTTYIYDPATIVLSCLLAWALARRNDPLLVVAFVLACLNKETAIVFVPVLLLVRWREQPRLRSRLLGIGLVAIWAVIRGEIARATAGQPRTVLVWHLTEHQVDLFWINRAALLFFIAYTWCFVALVRAGWRDKPREVRVGLLLTLLPLAAASIPIGYIDEARAWYDAYPYMFLAVAPTLWRVLGVGRAELREAAVPVPEAAG